MSKILCTDCPNKDDCTVYEVLNNTLDSKKVHKKISLQMDFIVTINEPEEFLEDWKEDIAGDIAENTACLAGFITDKVGAYNNIVQPLGAHLSVEDLDNKEAFNELSDYIKVTHEQTGNR